MPAETIGSISEWEAVVANMTKRPPEEVILVCSAGLKRDEENFLFRYARATAYTNSYEDREENSLLEDAETDLFYLLESVDRDATLEQETIWGWGV